MNLFNNTKSFYHYTKAALGMFVIAFIAVLVIGLGLFPASRDTLGGLAITFVFGFVFMWIWHAAWNMVRGEYRVARAMTKADDGRPKFVLGNWCGAIFVTNDGLSRDPIDAKLFTSPEEAASSLPSPPIQFIAGTVFEVFDIGAMFIGKDVEEWGRVWTPPKKDGPSHLDGLTEVLGNMNRSIEAVADKRLSVSVARVDGEDASTTSISS